MSINRQQIQRLEHKIAPLRNMDALTPPVGGWVNAIRTSLGMTLAQLAMRIGTNASRIKRIEQDEISGAVTLRTLSKVAEAMESELVYAIVPKKEIERIIQDRHAHITAKRHKNVFKHMALEDQAVDYQENLPLEAIEIKGLWND